MASLPYPLCHDCQADIVGMARMPYPPTICNEILTITFKKSNIYYLAIYIILFGNLIYITLPFILYYSSFASERSYWKLLEDNSLRS